MLNKVGLKPSVFTLIFFEKYYSAGKEVDKKYIKNQISCLYAIKIKRMRKMITPCRLKKINIYKTNNILLQAWHSWIRGKPIHRKPLI